MSIGESKGVVLSVEQALSLSYTTLRLVHHGFRVIRVEAVVEGDGRTAGDPNRYVGHPVAGADRSSYFVAPNVGKEAIAINLKRAQGRDLLKRLVRDLPVDIFCTNTLPARHSALGLEYEDLAEVRSELIWCGISALGPEFPHVVGYDPVLQAICGYMDITGHRDGPPLLCGPPIVDLKAGDEAFIQILVALLELERTGRGKRIDISMAQAAVSWLQTFLPLIDMGSSPDELRRNGNEHRLFVPVSVFETSDGHLFMAVGSDIQWRRLVQQQLFISLARPKYETNEGRRHHKDELMAEIDAITGGQTSSEIAEVLARAEVPHAPIASIEDVAERPCFSAAAIQTTTPDGRMVRLPPAAFTTDFLDRQGRTLSFAPRYGEHTESVLAEVGIGSDEVAFLKDDKVVV